jgi:hypothetical protein
MSLALRADNCCFALVVLPVVYWYAVVAVPVMGGASRDAVLTYGGGLLQVGDDHMAYDAGSSGSSSSSNTAECCTLCCLSCMLTVLCRCSCRVVLACCCGCPSV